jgi:hypothetical protein
MKEIPVISKLTSTNGREWFCGHCGERVYWANHRYYENGNPWNGPHECFAMTVLLAIEYPDAR